MIEKMDFADGKYTVINDNGKLTALRHGEPWDRDLVGDNLVYCMLVDSIRLVTQRDALLEALKEIQDWTARATARAASAKVEENKYE